MGIMSAIKAIVALIIVVIIAGGLYYVSNLQADLAVAKSNAERLEQGIKDQQAVIQAMEMDAAFQQNAYDELNEKLRDQQKALQDLQSKFNQSANGDPRDFGFIASRKPKLIERLVNKGTKNAMRCLEILSGSPLTEKELAADTASKANGECPEIANPNYIKVRP
jgi:uncharacterized coiled-coil protein SlyX